MITRNRHSTSAVTDNKQTNHNARDITPTASNSTRIEYCLVSIEMAVSDVLGTLLPGPPYYRLPHMSFTTLSVKTAKSSIDSESNRLVGKTTD